MTAFVWLGRRHRYLVVGWLWFLVALVPMIGLIQVWEQGMADRYAYQSFIGLFLIVCWGVKDSVARYRVPALAVAAVAVAVLVALGVAARIQTRYWTDSIAIWTRSLQVTPANNFVGEQSLGYVLTVAGRKDEAMPHIMKALQLRPEDGLSNLEVAFYEHQHGDFGAAIEHYKRVLVAPEVTFDMKRTALQNMARAYTAQGTRRKPANACAKPKPCRRATALRSSLDPVRHSSKSDCDSSSQPLPSLAQNHYSRDNSSTLLRALAPGTAARIYRETP